MVVQWVVNLRGHRSDLTFVYGRLVDFYGNSLLFLAFAALFRLFAGSRARVVYVSLPELPKLCLASLHVSAIGLVLVTLRSQRAFMVLAEFGLHNCIC